MTIPWMNVLSNTHKCYYTCYRDMRNDLIAENTSYSSDSGKDFILPQNIHYIISFISCTSWYLRTVSSSTGFEMRYSKFWIPEALHTSALIFSVNEYDNTSVVCCEGKCNSIASPITVSRIQHMWGAFCFSLCTYSHGLNFWLASEFLFLFVFCISR